MQSFIEIENKLLDNLEVKLMEEDLDNWYQCLDSFNSELYIPLQYKPEFIHYQAEYFRDVYPEYRDISMVLYRGGRPVGIWSVCMYRQDKKLCFGTAGSSLMGPLFSALPKAEAQRAVIENCLSALLNTLMENGGEKLVCNETVLNTGASQWIRKLMEHGANEKEVKWQAFVDLKLTNEEIQTRIRRTNKYSIAKGQNDYKIEVYDGSSSGLDDIFEEFHAMHRRVAGRETRSQSTWNIQKKIVQDGNDLCGRSFIVFIRDKNTGDLAGSALFDTTPQTGLYCVAAYDRSRFSKPVGHIVQAVAMDRMRSYGVRWYEIGERAYPGNIGVNEKLIDIGHYKEGFATHFFPRIIVEVDYQRFYDNILK